MKRMEWLDRYKDIIICLYNEGMKQSEIADEFETSQTAISTRLRKWNASNPDGNRFIRNDIKKEDLYRLYWEEEKHPVEIAEVYGCHKVTIRNFLKRYNIPIRTKSEARQGKLNPIYNVGHTKEARKKMSDAFQNGRKVGYHNSWGKSSWYNSPTQGKVRMRSGWEVKTADYLSELDLTWYYEPEWLYINATTKYLPDFYVKKLDLFIEVKGGHREEDFLKCNLAKSKYNNLVLWDGEELLKRGIISNSGNTEINRKYRKRKKN